MKCTIYSIVLLTSLLLFIQACKKTQPAAGNVEITAGQCKSNADTRNSVTICLDSVVEDSRCPLNVLCFWQGEAIAAFSLHINNESHPFKLSTFTVNNHHPANDTIIAGIRIRFVNLQPYPQTGTPSNEPTRATLDITGF